MKKKLVYSNFFKVNSSMNDVQIDFFRNIAREYIDEDGETFVDTDEKLQAIVTLGWRQTKSLAITLQDFVDEYEKNNGIIVMNSKQDNEPEEETNIQTGE